MGERRLRVRLPSMNAARQGISRGTGDPKRRPGGTSERETRMNRLPKRLMVGGALALLVGLFLDLVDRASNKRARSSTSGTLGDLVVQRTIDTAERLRDSLGDTLADSATRVKGVDIAGPATAGVDTVVDGVGHVREAARQQIVSSTSEGKVSLKRAATDIKAEAATVKSASKRQAAKTSASTKKAAGATKKKAASSTTAAKRRTTAKGGDLKSRGGQATTSAKKAVSPKDS
jgi:hypothetical protein